MYVNTVTFAGFAGKNAEIKTFKETMKVTNFNLCYKKTYNNKETICWMNVSAFGDAGKEAAKVKEGDNVVVTGSLNAYQYEKDGEKKTGVSISALSVGILNQEIPIGNPQTQVSGHIEDIPF